MRFFVFFEFFQEGIRIFELKITIKLDWGEKMTLLIFELAN